MFSYILRRTLSALALVVAVGSFALVLARLAPGDHLSEFELTPERIQAERTRLGLDRPLHAQYWEWLQDLSRLDLGESTRYPGRAVTALISERAGNTFLLGGCALIVATAVGLPLGVAAGSRTRGAVPRAVRGTSILLLALPPMVLSLAFLLLAARTGWFPVGGLAPDATATEFLRHLTLPVLALALPVAASLERLQASSISSALQHPSVAAARARGIPHRRILWRHAFRMSLTPLLAVYGIVVGSLLSGSFVVEYVMTWPGLGRLMYDGLVARDANLVAGCAALGAAFLSAGVLASDIALALVDPRRTR